MTEQSTKVVVAAGHHVASDRIETASLEELIFKTSSIAIARAGLTPEDVDAVVISGNDQTDGRIISCMVTAGAAAGVGKNVTMIASAPEHAFAYAYLRLLSGQGTNALIVGWSKPSESVFPEHAELVSADPFLVRPLGMNHVIASALQASALMHREADPTPVTSTDNAYVAWPLTADSYHEHADGVCAMVMELRDATDARPGAWVRGVGWAMDRYDLGDREDLEAGGLDAAMLQASKQAGPSFGPIDTLDTYAVGAPNERRLAARLAGSLGSDTTQVFSSQTEPSPDFAAGLFAIWRAAQRVLDSGRTGARHDAAAVATLGFASQGSTVVLLSDLTEA